jgi:hypothetical protein
VVALPITFVALGVGKGSAVLSAAGFAAEGGQGSGRLVGPTTLGTELAGHEVPCAISASRHSVHSSRPSSQSAGWSPPGLP